MSKIQELLQQEVSRKEFLRYAGVALLGLIGVATMLQNLTNTFTQTTTKVEKNQDAGYGLSSYGR